MKAEITIYQGDLAFIHDVGFSKLSESWAPGLLDILSDAEIDEGLIVDLGCGGGGWIEQLLKAGYRAIGVDVSPSMVELAQRRVPDADVRVASVWDFTFPKCHAVTGLSEVICYRSGDDDVPELESLFRQVFQSLHPGGLFIFDVTEVGLDRDTDRTFVECDTWACLVKYEYDEGHARLHRYVTSFRNVGALYRRTQEHHTLQLYEADEVMDKLMRVGFEVRRVSEFGKASLLPLRAGFIASKPRHSALS